jgi:hypothetical protein
MLLLFCTVTVTAQFRGGNGKGNTLAAAAKANLGRNIFTGGTDDGLASLRASSQLLGRNIFTGGPDDGFSSIAVKTQVLGTNIFTGGPDDGFASTRLNAQSLGHNIFLGGVNDGHALASLPAATLGKNIFIGGGNDGWAFAFVSKASLALPVTLSAFAAKWQLNDALISWQTSLEINTASFELQRSFDGTSFTAIHTTAAAGQSSVVQYYQYTDAGIKPLLPPAVNTVYYRLKTIDLDGRTSLSGIVVLRTDRTNSNTYAIYPNPARDIITIATTGATATNNGLIRLFDMSGRMLLQQKITSSNQQLSVGTLAGGTYFLQLSASGNILYTQKIIIQK